MITILWPLWHWPKPKKKPDEIPLPPFTIRQASGNDFLAMGHFPALQRTAIHRLSCTKIGAVDPKSESTVIQSYRGDRELVKSLLTAERRQRDKALWAEILKGTPTHQLSWGYTLKSSGEYRSLIDYAFNFAVDEYYPPWDIAQRVCEFIVHQAKDEQGARWGLLRSNSSIQFWHLVVARVVINLD